MDCAICLPVLTARMRNIPPVYNTENGMASDDEVIGGRVDDTQRISFLKRHLAAIDEAIKEGVDIRGYFVWSLMDNFEWAFGYERPLRRGACRTIGRSSAPLNAARN